MSKRGTLAARAGVASPLCRLSDDGSGGATSEDEGQDDREADEGDEDRTARAVDSMAMDAKAAAAADTTAVGSSWRTRWGRPRRRTRRRSRPQQTQPVVRGTGTHRKLLSVAGGRTRGRLERARFLRGMISGTRHSDSGSTSGMRMRKLLHGRMLAGRWSRITAHCVLRGPRYARRGTSKDGRRGGARRARDFAIGTRTL